MLNNILIKNIHIKNLCDLVLMYIGDYKELIKLGIRDPKVVTKIETSYNNMNKMENRVNLVNLAYNVGLVGFISIWRLCNGIRFNINKFW
jgi:hypothetical protein